MSLILLAGFFLLTTLSFQRGEARGELLLPPEAVKEGGLKPIEKRTNFRVPVETSFDPNFWPARGRRSGEEAEKGDACDEGFYEKEDFRCGGPPELREDKKRPGAADGDPEEEAPPEGDAARGECAPLARPLDLGGPGVASGNLLYAFGGKKDGRRHRKQRRFGLPQLLLYGNGVYWQLDNPLGEKKKKQDVFWVARGKKSFI